MTNLLIGQYVPSSAFAASTRLPHVDRAIYGHPLYRHITVIDQLLHITDTRQHLTNQPIPNIYTEHTSHDITTTQYAAQGAPPQHTAPWLGQQTSGDPHQRPILAGAVARHRHSNLLVICASPERGRYPCQLHSHALANTIERQQTRIVRVSWAKGGGSRT